MLELVIQQFGLFSSGRTNCKALLTDCPAFPSSLAIHVCSRLDVGAEPAYSTAAPGQRREAGLQAPSIRLYPAQTSLCDTPSHGINTTWNYKN